MKKWFFMLLLTIVFESQSFGQMVSSILPWQQKEFSVSASGQRTVAIVEHGFLLSFRQGELLARQSDVRLRSLNHDEEHDISLWSDSSSVWIEDVSLTSSRHILAAGSFVGAGSLAVNNFVWELSMDGQRIATLNLGDYAPARICAADENTFWTLGQSLTSDSAGDSYPVLRQYDFAGHLLRSNLERGNIPVGDLNWSTRMHAVAGPPGKTLLRCGEHFVGLYIGPARLWFEVNVDNGVSQLWKMKLPAGRVEITGLSMAKEHVVYGSFALLKALDGTSPEAISQRSLYKLDFTGAPIAAWEPLTGNDVSAGHDRNITLMGIDESSLVYRRHENSPRTWRLLWSRF